MNAVATVTQSQLVEPLLAVSPVRPVFIWGPPCAGTSSIVPRFASDVGPACDSPLGPQPAPEDLLGVPRLDGGTSRFCPPRTIARTEPYCLFLDELNACAHGVQTAFYSLIHERRIGEYHLPPGSIVNGTGDRARDFGHVRAETGVARFETGHAIVRLS